MFDCKEQLENCRTYVNMLNIRSLSANELFQLATIIYNCKSKAGLTEKALHKVVTKMKGMSEDSKAFVYDKLFKEHDSLNAIQLPHVTFQ